MAPPDPTLPAGNPFTNVQSSPHYWSATTDADDPTEAWLVTFVNGNVRTINKSLAFLVWCVRGGINADTY